MTAPPVMAVYPRRRVFKRLDTARATRLVWLSAPGGSGKTTAVRHWLSERGHPFLWYQVDEGDRDPATFFHYLRIAVSTHGAAAPKLFALRPEAVSNLKVFARRFFEALAQRLPPDCVLVLDDYQRAGLDLSWHDLLCEGLSALPEGITTIFISRGDPPASFARALAARAVDTIGWDTVRFTSEETRGMVRSRQGRKATRGPSFSRRLHELTDGWIAGLILLLRNPALDERELQRLDPAVSQHIFDYFATEVFEALDSEARTFLIKTSVLPTMSEGVAQALTRNPDAGRLLARLCRQSFFTERRGPGTYRYHTLFRAFLQERAAAVLGEAELASLRRTAGALMIEAGQPEEAFALVHAARDWTTLAAVVLSEAEGLVNQGRTKTLGRWLDALPSEVRDSNPWFAYWRAQVLLAYSPGEALAALERAYEGFRVSGNVDGICFASGTAIYALFLEGHCFVPIDAWLERLMGLGNPQSGVRCTTAVTYRAIGMVLGIATRWPWHPDRELWARIAFDVLVHSEDPNLRVLLGGVLLMHCSYWAASETGAAVLQVLSRGPGSTPADPLAEATLAMAKVMHAMSNTDLAKSLADAASAIEWLRSEGIEVWIPKLATTAAFGGLTYGDRDAAAPFIDILGRTASRAGRYGVEAHACLASWSAALAGNLTEAFALSDVSLEQSRRLGFPLGHLIITLERAQLWVLSGDRPAAAEALQQSAELVEQVGSDLFRCCWLFLKAEWALEESAEVSDAALSACLTFVREHRVANVFWMHPLFQARLCARAVERGIEPEVVAGLVRSQGLKPPPGSLTPLHAWPWPLRAHTLGRFDVLRDGRSLQSGDRSQRMPLRLLGALIAHGGHAASVATLCAALWPESEGDAARQVFDTTLHRLRKLIGLDDAILTRAETVGLNPAMWWNDNWALEAALRELEARLATAAPPHQVRGACEWILSLYQGPFLAHDDSIPDFIAARSRLRRKLMRSLLEAGLWLERVHELDGARAVYEQLIERDAEADGAIERLAALYQRMGWARESARLLQQTVRTATGA